MLRFIEEVKKALDGLLKAAIEYWSAIKKYLPKPETPVHPAKRMRGSGINRLRPQVLLNKPMCIMARSHC